MRLSLVLLLASLLILGATSTATAADIVEAWRSPFGYPQCVSADPADGSCWAATGASVMRLAADGTVLSQTDGFWHPRCLSVNSSDGSCWVIDAGDLPMGGDGRRGGSLCASTACNRDRSEDATNPIRGVERAFSDLRRIYEAAGASDLCSP